MFSRMFIPREIGNSFKVKGALCSFGEEIQTQNYEIIMQILFIFSINKLFSEENKVPGTQFEARKVAGSATCKQSHTV